MANYIATDTDLAAVADAIRAKTGTSEQLEFPSEFVSAIGSISGGEAEQKDVNYIDYDGTLLYSYTAQEYANLTEHPANPAHSGLTAEGWNWSLADAKSYVASYGKLWIGQMYITDDEKTRIYFSPSADTLSPYLGCAVNGTATVDWGDNSTTETMTGSDTTTLVQLQHTYAVAGDYVITILPSSGSQIAFVGDYTVYQRIINELPSDAFPNTYTLENPYGSRVTKLELGRGVILSSYGLGYLTGIKTITIPKECESTGNAALVYNYSLIALVTPKVESGLFVSGGGSYSQALKRVSLSSNTKPDLISFYYGGGEEITFPTGGAAASFESNYQVREIIIPDGATSISQNFAYKAYNLRRVRLPSTLTQIPMNAFSSAYSLSDVNIPSGVTSIVNNAFNGCAALRAIEIPSSVTALGQGAFNACTSLKEIVLPTSITTIPTNCFQGCNALQKAVIPASVTAIQAKAFMSCAALREIHFKGSTPPSIANANAFTGINADCVIYIPTGSLSAYTSATNYPSSSTYTYVEE